MLDRFDGNTSTKNRSNSPVTVATTGTGARAVVVTPRGKVSKGAMAETELRQEERPGNPAPPSLDHLAGPAGTAVDGDDA